MIQKFIEEYQESMKIINSKRRYLSAQEQMAFQKFKLKCSSELNEHCSVDICDDLKQDTASVKHKQPNCS